MLGKIFRIGHLGYCDRTDILMTVAALECVLSDLGVPIMLGEGVKAVQKVFLK
jgi:aspartate aminotransferase-like enzyme